MFFFKTKTLYKYIYQAVAVTLFTSVVPEERAPTEAESFVSGVETAAVEEIREAVAEERKITEAAPERPLQSVAGREDDWFVLLDVVPRETSYVPPGIATILCAAALLYQKEAFVPNFFF